MVEVDCHPYQLGHMTGVYFRDQFYFVTFGPYNLKSCFMDEEIIFMKNNRYFRILLPKILENFWHFKCFGILGTNGLPGPHAEQVNLLKGDQINFSN